MSNWAIIGSRDAPWRDEALASPDVPAVALTRLFYDDPDALALFRPAAADALPPTYRRLLAHANLMTTTLEDRHGGAIDLEVLEAEVRGSVYGRKAVLRRHADRSPVEFAILRVELDRFDERVRRRIVAGDAPLGRILVEHRLSCAVELSGLWEVEARAELIRTLALPGPARTYGRTAAIRCDGHAAVQVLEIVAPMAPD